ncbi:hypothetical protein Tco_0098987, partial [Tanacetum coccineum]
VRISVGIDNEAATSMTRVAEDDETQRYSDKHNMLAFLKKPTESVGLTEIVDFIKGTSLSYALTHNPTIHDSLVKQFWQTATVRSLANGIQELVASIDNKKYTITEASVRSKLQLADATGISNLPDAEIYEGLATLGGYAWEHVPLLPAMLAGATEDQGEGSTNPVDPNPTSIDPVLSTSQPPIPSITELPHSSPLRPIDRQGAATTTSGLDAGMDSGNIHESPLRSHEAPLPEGNTSGSAEDSLQLKELMAIVPKMVTKIDSLEKELKETKQTLGHAVLTLVKKVKSLEVALKRMSKRVILSDSEDEETENRAQGSEERVKRAGVQLEQESSKKQKIAVEDVPVTEEKVEVVKKEESIKRTGKRKKQKARKGTHADKTAKHEAEEDMEALVKGNDTDSSSGTDIPVSVVPVAIKPPSIANWKIINVGNKGVYQIIMRYGYYITYRNFGAILKSISRDALTELYRLVMQKYGTNGPEDEYERVFWGDLKTMFDPPLSTDPVWNLPYQQKMLRWRYYDTCRVHCLTLESADIYMLTERRYPIPADVCQAMLDKKLQGDKKDKACYQLLKLIEKQAQNKLP